MAANSAFLARVYELSGAKTPTDLARWVGLSLTAVLNWESGKSAPQLKTLRKIREKTGEDLSGLVEAPGANGPRGRRETIQSLGYGIGLEQKPSAVEARISTADYIRRVEEDHREAKRAGRRKDDQVPLIQLMAALRRITASEDWAKRSAVIQVLLAFDPEIRDRWPEIQDTEVDALRRLLAIGDAERHQEG